MLKKYNKIKVLPSLLLLALPLFFVSCDKDDDDASNDIVLESFGPTVLRGEELRFIGKNLTKVTSIVLPQGVEIPASSFKTHTATLIVIDVPDNATEGLVTL